MNYCGNEGKVIRRLSVGRSRVWRGGKRKRLGGEIIISRGARYALMGSPTLPQGGSWGENGELGVKRGISTAPTEAMYPSV